MTAYSALSHGSKRSVFHLGNYRQHSGLKGSSGQLGQFGRTMEVHRVKADFDPCLDPSGTCSLTMQALARESSRLSQLEAYIVILAEVQNRMYGVVFAPGSQHVLALSKNEHL